MKRQSMLYETVELEDGTLAKFCTPCWDTEVDPETTHEDLVYLKRIAQHVREELARAKPGSAVWEAMSFTLSLPIKGTEERTEKEPTWEAPSNHIDYPEPDQAYGAADD